MSETAAVAAGHVAMEQQRRSGLRISPWSLVQMGGPCSHACSHKTHSWVLYRCADVQAHIRAGARGCRPALHNHQVRCPV